MDLYPTPIPAGYTYKTRNFDGTFNEFYASVLILGETRKSYLVRIAVPLGNHRAGDRMTVRKHNVTLKAATPAHAREHDYSNAYWQK